MHQAAEAIAQELKAREREINSDETLREITITLKFDRTGRNGVHAVIFSKACGRECR